MKLKPEQELGAWSIVKGLPLFTGCPDGLFQAIAKLFDAREFLPGKVVLMDQEIARTLFVLAKGSVSVWKRVGGEKKQLATLQAPNFFGERAMFEESPASALVKSETACTIYALERAAFDLIAVQYPASPDIIRKNMIEIREKRMGPVVPKHEGES